METGIQQLELALGPGFPELPCGDSLYGARNRGVYKVMYCLFNKLQFLKGLKLVRTAGTRTKLEEYIGGATNRSFTGLIRA
mmetsp:Transcript_67458/g.140973  ORF Transcript_67458/g.140973 Transcript_67458/m.140973 type:complete len:81 (-) Transcript_67458:1358-1600(-)